MFISYAIKNHLQNGQETPLAFPVKVLLHQSRLRYYVDSETAGSLSVFWPELRFPPATALSEGDFFEVSVQTHQFSRLDPSQQQDRPVYYLPKVSGEFDLKSIHLWFASLHQGHEWLQPEPPLALVAAELIAKISGTERFNTFRLSEPMQKLKRERNEFARALSLSSEPNTSRHLLNQLMHSVSSIKEQEAIAKEVLYAMKGASIASVRQMLSAAPELAEALDKVLHSLQHQTPLREVHFKSSIEPALRQKLSYTLQGLREQWAHGEIKLPYAVQRIQNLSEKTSALNPVELTDLLHQTFHRRLSEQVGLLHHMVECVNSFPQKTGIQNTTHPTQPTEPDYDTTIRQAPRPRF